VNIIVKQAGIAGSGRDSRQRRAYSLGCSPTSSLNAELSSRERTTQPTVV
jgi:hypothetical protein